MKISYITVDVAVPYYRGASTHVYEVAKNLTRLGHEVHVISRRINPAHSDYEILEGVHVHRIYRGIMGPLPFTSLQRFERGEETPVNLRGKLYEAYLFTINALYAGFAASHLIKKCSIEIIIERETSFGAGAIASMITKRPMVLEVIGPRYSKRSLKKAEKVLAYTKSMIYDYVPPKKLALVTAAANVEHFKPNSVEGKLIRERYGFQDSIVIGYVGNFAEWHGIDELIDASRKVLKRFSDARFLMVGPYCEYAKELAQKRGVLSAYVFTGPVSYVDVPKYINAANILVAPYNPAKSEFRRKYGIGSPLKVFEYMACGKPVITTFVEPIIDVVRNGKTGVLVPPGDSEALSEAIIYLMEKTALSKSMGEAARKDVEKYYSWEAFTLRLEDILKETLRSCRQH